MRGFHLAHEKSAHSGEVLSSMDFHNRPPLEPLRSTELLLKLVESVPQHLSSLEAHKEQRPGMNISDPYSG